jgi:hypothetical protein
MDTIADFKNREALLTANSALIAQIQDRLKTQRFRMRDEDSVKLSYFSTLVEALKLQNNILTNIE